MSGEKLPWSKEEESLEASFNANPDAVRNRQLDSYRHMISIGIEPKKAAEFLGLEFPDEPLVAGHGALS